MSRGNNQTSSGSETEDRRAPRGFTLVELLVVIGIITLLIAILLPALSKAREGAKVVACLSNMRTLGQAVGIYQSENRGNFPPVFAYDVGAAPWAVGYRAGSTANSQDMLFWGILSLSAATNARVCPSVDDWLPHQSYTNPAFGNFTYQYSSVLGGYNSTPATGTNLRGCYQVNGTGPWYSTPVHQIPNASETLMFIDYPQLVVFSLTDDRGSYSVMTYPQNPIVQTVTINGVSVTHQIAHSIAPVHNRKPSYAKFSNFSDGQPTVQGQVNVCFADGSASTIPIVQGQIDNSVTTSSASTLLAVPPANPVTQNGAFIDGGTGIIPGVRWDPALAP